MLDLREKLDDHPHDRANLARPRVVRDLHVHKEYLRAGARVIETNTFSANRVKLGLHNLGENVREKINIAGARLACEAVGVAYLMPPASMPHLAGGDDIEPSV